MQLLSGKWALSSGAAPARAVPHFQHASNASSWGSSQEAHFHIGIFLASITKGTPACAFREFLAATASRLPIHSRFLDQAGGVQFTIVASLSLLSASGGTWAIIVASASTGI